MGVGNVGFFPKLFFQKKQKNGHPAWEVLFLTILKKSKST